MLNQTFIRFDGADLQTISSFVVIVQKAILLFNVQSAEHNYALLGEETVLKISTQPRYGHKKGNLVRFRLSSSLLDMRQRSK